MHALPSALSLAWLALAPLAAPAQVPALSHTAPQIGNELTIELAGALPGVSVRLYFSSGEASTATPFGTLELERNGLTLIASGPADPQGHFVHQQLVPPDPALAETWGHYQALVQDASAPNGWVLSQAVHLRYLGTRLYETSLGASSNLVTQPAELRVVSLLQARCLGLVPLADKPLPSPPWYALGPWEDEGEPVFSDDLSLGAVVPFEDRLVVFDNFGLTQRLVLPMRDVNLDLAPGLDGQSVVALEFGADRIVWVDLATATVTDTLSLPLPLSGHWTVMPGDREAWVGENDPGQLRPALRRVDLENRVVLESVLVGSPDGCFLTDVVSGANTVLAASQYWGLPGDDSVSLSAVDRSSLPASVQTVELGSVLIRPLMVMGDLVAVALHESTFPSSATLRISNLQDPLALREMPPPPSYYQNNDIEYRAFEKDGDGFWALHPCCDSWGGPGAILHFSIPTKTWTEIGELHNGGPNALALARDDFIDQIAVAVDADPWGWYYPPPHIDLLEVSTLTRCSIPGSWGPIALHALTVP